MYHCNHCDLCNLCLSHFTDATLRRTLITFGSLADVVLEVEAPADVVQPEEHHGRVPGAVHRPPDAAQPHPAAGGQAGQLVVLGLGGHLELPHLVGPSLLQVDISGEENKIDKFVREYFFKDKSILMDSEEDHSLN